MKRRVLLPTISMDRASRDPLHRQLATALRSAIETGDLPRGSVLPSTRALAEALGVSRNTVVTAYDELTAEGVLIAQPGSGTRVFGKAAITRIPDRRGILRASQYPVDAVSLRDPDGNALYFHR